MKSVDQLIAIHKACGHKIPMFDAANYFYTREPEMRVDLSEIPNYLGCLNAMHEAEKVLTGAQHQYYYANLERVCSGQPFDRDGFYGAGWIYHNVHATAAQRAEAFLRTVGLWKDES